MLLVITPGKEANRTVMSKTTCITTLPLYSLHSPALVHFFFFLWLEKITTLILWLSFCCFIDLLLMLVLKILFTFIDSLIYRSEILLYYSFVNCFFIQQLDSHSCPLICDTFSPLYM